SPALLVVRYCVTQCRPPSAVCRIRSEPTTQPSAEPTNWTAFRVGFAGPLEAAACWAVAPPLPSDGPPDRLRARLARAAGAGVGGGWGRGGGCGWGRPGASETCRTQRPTRAQARAVRPRSAWLRG